MKAKTLLTGAAVAMLAASPALAQTTPAVTDPFANLYDGFEPYIPYIITGMVGLASIMFGPRAVRVGIKWIQGFAR
jgi:hypothetical protein